MMTVIVDGMVMPRVREEQVMYMKKVRLDETEDDMMQVVDGVAEVAMKWRARIMVQEEVDEVELQAVEAQGEVVAIMVVDVVVEEEAVEEEVVEVEVELVELEEGDGGGIGGGIGLIK